MKDFFGQELKVGDTVAFMRTGYRELSEGLIISTTAKMVNIAHKEMVDGNDLGYKLKDHTRQFPGQVIKKVQ